MKKPAITLLFTSIFALLTTAGCVPSSENMTTEDPSAALSKLDPKEGDIDPNFQLGDLALERQKTLGFTAPADLAALDAYVAEHGGWVENELRDGERLTYQYLNGTPAPMTVAQARELRNRNEEENAAILHTLGRLPSDEPIPVDQEYAEVNYDAEFVRHMPADANSLNPLLASSVADQEMSGMTGISLFGFTYDTFEPYVNTDTNVAWRSSADRLVDRITLRDDLTWSDGQPFTAHDVEFTYRLIMTSAVPIPAMRSGTDLLVDVKAYDDRTIVFFHEKAMPINIFNMQFSLIPRHIYEDSAPRDPTLVRSRWHVQLEKTPVVAGVYYVERRTKNQEVVFKRREGYYMHNGKQVRPKAFINRVRFRISPDVTSSVVQMIKGDIEEMTLTPELWCAQANEDAYAARNMKVTDTGWTYFAFWWNLQNPMFQDKRVREALSCAFNHEEMLRVHRYGLDTPCRGLFAETSPWFPKDADIPPLKRDVERARALLRDAGWEDSNGDGFLDRMEGGKRRDFRFTMIVTNKQDRVALCNLMSQNLREIGIDCTVQALEFNVWMQNMHDKKFEAAFGGWGAGADPYSAWNVWGSNEARNNISYSNPEVDRLFREGEVEFDRAKRMAIYQKIHLLIYEDCPCTWLFNQNEYCGFSKLVRGLGFYARGPIAGSVWKEAAVR